MGPSALGGGWTARHAGDMDTLLAIALATWVAVGLVVAVVMHRRGHDLGVWALLGVVFGPFTIPLASRQVQRALWVAPQEVSTGRHGPGEVDVLVGIDGSEEACAAAESVVAALGPAIRRLTLASVMDLDEAVTHVDPPDPAFWDEDRRHEDACRAWLEDATGRLGEVRPATVILGGDPAAALAHEAAANDYDFLVVGPRGKGASRALLGSVSTRLARRSLVPVILGPDPAIAGKAGGDFRGRPTTTQPAPGPTERSQSDLDADAPARP